MERLKMTRKKTIERIPVRCLVCQYEWHYSKGIPKYWVKCPDVALFDNKSEEPIIKSEINDNKFDK